MHLQAVAARASTDAWAVGNISGSQAVIMHWDGAQWNGIISPLAASLTGVAATAAGDAWTVGAGAVILHWNGMDWQQVPNAVPSGDLNGVAARTSADAWAVGARHPYALLEHWNGQTWTVVPGPTPQPGTTNEELLGVAAIAADNVWAVGYYVGGVPNAAYPLIMHWTGQAWQAVAAPGGAGTILTAVAVRAANDAWAVGYRNSQTVTAHWDGATWSLVSSPSPNSYSVLRGVAALAANDVWAVGARGNQSESLVLHWDGQAWSTFTSVSSEYADYSLYGVSALNSVAIWAVGESSDEVGYHALVAEYTGPPAFSDVPSTYPFYAYIHCLAWHGAIGGYSDCTFRPGSDVTRGQLAKILSDSANYSDGFLPPQHTFADVLPADPFWLWIERLVLHGAISGYACGGPGEPCDSQNRPYFRPGASATRGQIAKITALAAQIADPVPSTQQTFADVPPGNAFRLWIEQLAGRGVISGYQCGGPGEPCDPQNRPYFRWSATTTRGQLAKIAANTFFPNCNTPPRR